MKQCITFCLTLLCCIFFRKSPKNQCAHVLSATMFFPQSCFFSIGKKGRKEIDFYSR